MKKLVAVLMILCLAVSAAAVFAEDAEPNIVQWSDYAADAAGIEGEFAHISSTGLIMFIPAEFKDSEISEEALAGGKIMVLKTENEERAVVSAQVIEYDVETFLGSIVNEGVTVWHTILNGLNCYQFNLDTLGVVTSCIVYSTEQGGSLIFSFTLSDEEPYASMYKVMAASIQPAE